MEEEKKEIGRIEHYYPKIGVAVVALKAPVKVGAKILVKGSVTNFEQTVESMQVEHKDVQSAEAGESIGLKMKDRVRENDTVYM